MVCAFEKLFVIRMMTSSAVACNFLVWFWDGNIGFDIASVSRSRLNFAQAFDEIALPLSKNGCCITLRHLGAQILASFWRFVPDLLNAVDPNFEVGVMIRAIEELVVIRMCASSTIPCNLLIWLTVSNRGFNSWDSNIWLDVASIARSRLNFLHAF